ncbi:MAG: LamG-like jellyroll fold domain-containing protein [Bacteroidia bacterium]
MMKVYLLLTTAIVLSIKILAQIPTNGLVARYDFNGNANDLTGNGYNGVVNNATLTTDRFGNANSAYNFNGTNANINLSNTAGINFTNGITFSAWAYTVHDTNASIVDKMLMPPNAEGFRISVRAPGFGNNYVASAGLYGAGVAANSIPPVILNTWIFISGTWGTDDTVRIYINGQLQGKAYRLYSNSNSQQILIGKGSFNSGYEAFHGKIDDICIYNRALISTEVTQIYSGTCQADLTTGLVSKYDFSGNANDGSGNSNNGIVNGATLTADRYGNPNSAYSFNGNKITVPDNSTLNFGVNQSFTISSWLKLNGSNSGFNGIVCKMDANGNGYQLALSNNKLKVEFGSSSVGAGLEGNRDLNDGIWHLINFVVDRQNNQLAFYIDGNLDTITTDTDVSIANVNNSVDLTMGVERLNIFYLNGDLDEVKIYNRALTVCDIDSLYNINPCTGITANITAGGPIAFCQGDNVVLTASSANGYLWSNSATTQSITVNTAGNYSVTCTNSGGCSGTSAATTVTVNALPVVTANATANSICIGSSVTLTGGGASTYTWTSGITNGTAFSPISTASYTVTGTDGNGCTNTATKTITVNPLPVVSINTVPGFININASAIALTGSPAGGTFTGNGINNNNFTPLTAGLGTSQITYNYTNSNNCSNSSVTSTIVYDTMGILCTSFDTTYISVTDTLIINATLTGINPPNNMNTLRIYPNPASTHIYIDNGNYTSMAGYTVTIKNNLGQTVFTSSINQQQFYIDLSTWSGNGIYFVHIIDAVNNTIEVKKIVLQ